MAFFLRNEIISFELMKLEEFMKSLKGGVPPSVEPMLTALWFDYQGDWDKAHDIVQDSGGTMASWIHAYLHRKEGDLGNASYWYSRAGKNRPSYDLETEWKELVNELVEK